MKRNYILALFLSLVLIVATYYIGNGAITYSVQVKDALNDSTCKIKEINEEKEKYIIKAYMPYTGIEQLDKKIEISYNTIIEDFKKEVDTLEVLGSGKKFSLSINFNSYEYDNYQSFLISYLCYYGGAHPNSEAVTINYNKKDGNFVDIDTLVSKDKEVLNTFSKYSYDSLKDKKDMSENEDMLITGTKPKKENFQKFVFSNEGLILFFTNYSVAPYYLGDFEVVIPYDKINI